MPRYIDANKIDYTVTMVGIDENAGYRAVAFESDIDAMPTADVVEVVRCRVCKKYQEYTNFWGYCDPLYNPKIVKPDDFCSYGERIEIND